MIAVDHQSADLARLRERGFHPERFSHGTRARYVALKCRCHPCRAANAAYQRTRASQPGNPLVPADKAREHLAALSAQGVGRHAVQAASDVSGSVLADIISGAKPRIRAETERRILEVDAGAIADGALVPAAETRAAIREMLLLGLTKTEIAERLGYKTGALQLTRPRVTARNAFRVRRLLAEVREEVARSDAMPEICASCGLSHAPADRRRVLARMLPCTYSEFCEAWPCFYSDGVNGERRFYRDVEAIKAVSR